MRVLNKHRKVGNRLMSSTEAKLFPKLPVSGTSEERIFVWLVNINNTFVDKLRLSDSELKGVSYAIARNLV